jgi:Flp pilus assembly protein TadD
VKKEIEMKSNGVGSAVKAASRGAMTGVLIVCMGCLFTAAPLAAQNVQPQSQPAEGTQQQPAQSPPQVTFAPPLEKAPDELFKEAAATAAKDPEGAVRLYRRAVQIKPDAWGERRKLAILLEGQGKLNAAVSEYGLINSATGSAESFRDLISALEKSGLVNAASPVALSGTMKFPDDPELTRKAGALLLRTGKADTALVILKKGVEKWPDDGQMLYQFGQACEKNGKDADAFRAYLRVASRPGSKNDIKAAMNRVRSRAVSLEGFWLFPPRGFVSEGNMLVNTIEDQRIVVEGYAGSDPKGAALRVVHERMPAGMFTDEKIREYDRIRQAVAELSKTSPDLAKQVPPMAMPVFIEKPLAGAEKGLLVLASTGEESSPLVRSVYVLALTRGDRTYTVSWMSTKPRAEGEKIILSLLEQIVFPL